MGSRHGWGGTAHDFYTKLLGWRIEPLPVEQMTYWRGYVDGQEQAGIMSMPRMVPAEVPSYWLPYFVVVDAKVSTPEAA